MQKISMLLFLALFLLSCQPEEDEFTNLDFTVRTEIQNSKEKNDANRIRVRNIEALKKLPFPNTKNRKEVLVLGYYEPGDGGGGNFYWDPISTEEDNGGTIISVQNNEKGRWKREYKETINVKWFGAKGDGYSDDTRNLQNVFLQLGDIVFSPGIYLIHSSLISTFNNRLIKGEGDVIIKLADSSYSEMIVIANSKNVVVENLLIDGNAFGNPLDVGGYKLKNIDMGINSTSGCLKISESENILIKGIKVQNAFIAPIVLYDTKNSKIENCISLNHQREGIGIVGGENCQVLNCHSESENSIIAWSLYWTAGIPGEFKNHNHILENNVAINSQAAFITVNTTYTKILNNTIIKTVNNNFTSGSGIRLGHLPKDNDDYLSAINSVVSGNRISGLKPIHPSGNDSGNRAISIDNGSGSLIEKNIITNCNAGIGSTLKIDKTLTIKNNILSNIIECAIYIDFGKSSIIEGNRISNCNEGIRSRQGRGKILNNTIDFYSKYGIRVLYGASKDISGHEIIGNKLRDGGVDSKSFVIDAANSQVFSENEFL